MLQIPPVYVIKLFKVLVLAGDNPDCDNPVAADSEQHYIARLRLSGEAANPPAVVVLIASVGGLMRSSA
jgi:hypothetical protein